MIKPLLASLLLAVVTAVGLLIVVEPAQAAFPGKNGKIAFEVYSTDGSYHSDIYTVDPDGSEATNLTNVNGSVFNLDASFSPDGTKIAFARTEEGSYYPEIYVMNADGSELTRLTYTSSAQNFAPTWSPDSAKIAFARDGEIYTINVDGSGQRRLTRDEAVDEAPAWSPDGDKIAFEKDEEIYIMNVNGSKQMNLTNAPGNDEDSNPAWSPDGTKIVFDTIRHSNPCSAHCGPPRWDIYVMNADGSGQTRLTGDLADGASDPAWSPDGTKIAYAAKGPAYGEIGIMNPDGSGKTLLANPGVRGFVDDWGVAPGCKAGQYQADYYNQTLDGDPALTRCEDSIDNDWGIGGSPGSEVASNFSARWTGKHQFKAGKYTFTAIADDGIKVWVDGKLIIDGWLDQPATTYTATRKMKAGIHEIKVEYYDSAAHGVAKVDWQKKPGKTKKRRG